MVDTQESKVATVAMIAGMIMAGGERIRVADAVKDAVEIWDEARRQVPAIVEEPG